MRFYRLNEILIRDDDKVFKSDPSSMVFMITIWLLGIAGIAVGVCGGIQGRGGFHGIPSGAGYLFGGALCWFGLLLVGSFRAYLKPTNWLFRCDNTGIIIKYRSYLNWRLPQEDIQAVGFGYHEIAWIKKTKERRVSPNRGVRKTVEYKTYLDICLKDSNTAELEQRLETEQQCKHNPLYLDYPVRVLPGGIIRMRWRGILDYFLPRAGDAMVWLSQFVQITPTELEKLNLIRNRKDAIQKDDTEIINLVRSGDKMAAIRLTREMYGCSLTEAVEFVEKLQPNTKK